MTNFLCCRFSFFIVLVVQVSAILADVTWDSPTAGDVYNPGDTLQVVWTSSTKLVSPSFTICTSNSTRENDNPDCGTAVQPDVRQNGSEYSLSLAVPNITGEGSYYLEMKDDTGTVYDTPNFSLALADDAVSDANATSASDTSVPTSTVIAFVPSHSSSAAAAIAIPLSLVAAVLLGAFVLLLSRAHRFRKRERERAKRFQEAREQEYRSKLAYINFASESDIERALWTLSANRGHDPFVQPLPPTSASVSPSLKSVAATALGINVLGWNHVSTPAVTSPPPVVDPYTPAPVRRFAMGSSARSLSSRRFPHAPHTRQYTPTPNEPEILRRPGDGLESDLRAMDYSFTEKSMASKLSDTASFPRSRVSTPLPLLPKPLVPGKLDIHAPHARVLPSRSSLPATESRSLLRPEMEHVSLNVISDYAQASPALPQAHVYNTMEEYGFASAPRASRVSLTHHVDTLHDGQMFEKSLPSRPEGRDETDLYSAVLKVVGREPSKFS